MLHPRLFRDDGSTLSEAARMLGAESMAEARRLARDELWAARHCMACRWFLLNAPRVRRSSDPRELLEALDPWQRDEHTARLAAALIVLRGT